ncbi:MAG: amino acid racemase [Lachnospiraceae bacterium]|nr:amino acid racemase [Lachnospiraceae bacterium]
MASAYFLQMVTEMTDAAEDQEHIEVLLHSCPQIPDRTRFLLGKSSEDPCPPMIRIGRQLAENGAQRIAIPCVTANFFYDRLCREIPVPVIDIISETAEYLSARDIKCVGLMATDGTVRCGFFQKQLEVFGIRVVLPSDERQADVMAVIYQDVKANRPVDMDRFSKAAEELRAKGSEVILLGCTELSMARRDNGIGAGYLDVMQLMAKVSVEHCGRLKAAYTELITKYTG